MNFFLLHPFLLIFLLFFYIIKLTEDRIIIMSFPILFHNYLFFIILLIFYSFFMVLFIHSSYDVVLLHIIYEQIFLTLNWQPQISILEKKIRQHLIVYHVVCICYRSQLFVWNAWKLIQWFSPVLAIAVDNIIRFFVFGILFLNLEEILRYGSWGI